jgi:hypothetical protein
MKPNILMPIMIFMTRYYHSSNLQHRFFSGTVTLLNIFRLTFFVLMIVFVSSCEEGPTKIGSGLLPESDFVSIYSTDTLSVRSFTMFDKTFRTDSPSGSYLGETYDPYFGTTTAGFVTQIRLGSTWIEGFSIDSMKLILALNAKGGEGSTHTLRLSEIGTQIYTDSAYYSDQKVDTTGYGISLELPALRTDSTNYVTIPVPKEFGIYITREPSQLFYNNSLTDFRSYFKGLYFHITSSTNPVITGINLQPSSSTGSYSNYFVLFGLDSLGTYKEFYFILDAVNRNAAYNLIEHKHSTATRGSLLQHLNDTSFSNMDSLSYQQSLNGVYTMIRIPGLEKLKTNPSFRNSTINKARLTFPIFTDVNNFEKANLPSNIYLRYKTSDGSKYVVPDYGIDPQYHYFFNGTIDTVANVYTFNIPAFVQGYLRDTIANSIRPELELFLGEETKNAILKTSRSKSPVKFDITYTKF